MLETIDIDSYETYFKLTEKDSFDITSDTFLNNKKWTKYLTSNKDKEFGIWFTDGTVQPYKKNTTMKDINKLTHHPPITKITPTLLLLSPRTCQPTFAE